MNRATKKWKERVMISYGARRRTSRKETQQKREKTRGLTAWRNMGHPSKGRQD